MGVIALIQFILALSTPVFAEDAGEVVDGLRGTLDGDAVETQVLATPRNFKSCNGKAQAPIRVVFDITRGVQQARVYEGTKLVRKPYKISGGRNKLEYNDHEGRVCSYTSVGQIKPKQLIIDRKSTAHNGAPMPYYVDLHSERAVGAHAGDTSGYSGGCIRQSRSDAKWLYDFVKEHSNLYGNNEISCSDVTFEIIDNTPGVAQARAKCFAGIKRDNPVLALDESVPQIPRPRPYITGDALPTDRFVPVVHDKKAYKRQYRYLNEGMQPQKLPEGTLTSLY